MTTKKKKPEAAPAAEPISERKLKAVLASGPTPKKIEATPAAEPASKKKPKTAAVSEPPPPAAEVPPKHGIFKQPLSKPEPWRFGGRGPRSAAGGDGKPQKDAERRGGKSRKVH